MDLDPELAILILSISVVTGLAVYFVSVFGVKEKSFEEAIKEQKSLSEELLGKVPKKKKKKEDKIGKKKKVIENVPEIVPEKIEEVEEIEIEEVEKPPKEEKKHVEIIDQPSEITRKLSIVPPPTATPTKSILLHNEQEEEKEPAAAPNHFLSHPPKDELEIQKGKKKKGSKNEELYANLGSLSPEETQLLIDTLLTRQTVAWTLPRDSLKTKLETKEKQLMELESNYLQVQNKLKELRLEQTGEKSKNLLQKKQFEEIINAKQVEVNNLSLRVRQLGEVREKEILMGMKFKEEMERWRGKCEGVEREVGAVKGQYQKQGAQLELAFTSNEELTKKVHLLQSNLNSLQQNAVQINFLNRSISEKDSVISQLEVGLGEVRGRIEELQGKEVEYAEIIRRVEGERGELGGRNESLQSKNTALLKSLQSTEAQLEETLKKFKEYEEKVSTILKAVGVNSIEETEVKFKALEEKIVHLEDVEKRSNLLEKEVEHYQIVLKETETLLATLQNSIESEEKKWEEKKAEVEQILGEESLELTPERKKKRKVLGFKF